MTRLVLLTGRTTILVENWKFLNDFVTCSPVASLRGSLCEVCLKTFGSNQGFYYLALTVVYFLKYWVIVIVNFFSLVLLLFPPFYFEKKKDPHHLLES